MICRKYLHHFNRGRTLQVATLSHLNKTGFMGFKIICHVIDGVLVPSGTGYPIYLIVWKRACSVAVHILSSRVYSIYLLATKVVHSSLHNNHAASTEEQLSTSDYVIDTLMR